MKNQEPQGTGPTKVERKKQVQRQIKWTKVQSQEHRELQKQTENAVPLWVALWFPHMQCAWPTLECQCDIHGSRSCASNHRLSRYNRSMEKKHAPKRRNISWINPMCPQSCMYFFCDYPVEYPIPELRCKGWWIQRMSSSNFFWQVLSLLGSLSLLGWHRGVSGKCMSFMCYMSTERFNLTTVKHRTHLLPGMTIQIWQHATALIPHLDWVAPWKWCASTGLTADTHTDSLLTSAHAHIRTSTAPSNKNQNKRNAYFVHAVQVVVLAKVL